RPTKPVLLRRRGRRRYRFFAFFDVKKRGFACKPSRYAFAGRPGKSRAKTGVSRAPGAKPGNSVSPDAIMAAIAIRTYSMASIRTFCRSV
ncbi:MAG: hypothetical protein ACLQDI_08840, partial [Syntrophobacteraceae bacterium]